MKNIKLLPLKMKPLKIFGLASEIKNAWPLQKNLKIITVKILEFGTPQTIAIIVIKIEMFDVTLH